MNKQALIEKIKTKPSWNKEELLNTITHLKAQKCPPTELKNGDVFIHRGLNHPVVIIDAHNAIGVMLSGTQGVHTIMEVSSRFLPNNYVTTCLIKIEMEAALVSFLCCYDNPLEVYRIKKKVKKYWETLLK